MKNVVANVVSDGSIVEWQVSSVGDSGAAAIATFCSDVIAEARFKCVRVLGLRRNTALVCRLYERFLRQPDFRMEIAGPNAFGRESMVDDNMDVDRILFRMGLAAAPAVGGGWHVATPCDYITYQLASASDGNVRWHWLKMHPAWPGISFIDRLNRDSVASVLAEIRDPRHFNHPIQPGRVSKLLAYMGVWPKHRDTPRYAVTVAAWKTYETEAASEEHSTDVANYPSRWLWRIADERGERAAAKSFLTFVYHVWLDALYGESSVERIFSPEIYFHSPVEVAAFYQHTERRIV